MAIRSLNKELTKWQVDYYPAGGKGRRSRINFEGSQAEALAYEAELRRTHASAMPVSPKLIDVIPEWLEWLKLHRSESYHYDAEKTLKWLIPAFGKLKFTGITHTVIDQYKRNRRGSSKYECIRTINKELGNLSALVSWAVKRGYANPLPFKIEKLPYARPVPQIPHPVEFDRFLNALNIHKAYLREGSPKNAKKGFEERRAKKLVELAQKRALILLLWECGLRWKEASHVRWENIDWINGTIYLKVTKGSKPRYAVLTENIRTILLAQKKEDGWVFENHKTGKPWLSFSTLFRTARKEAKIKRLHPHLLRHAFGTFTLEATGDLRLVQDLLGHRDVGTTQFYTQVATHRLKAGTQKTSDYISQMKSEQLIKKAKESEPTE